MIGIIICILLILTAFLVSIVTRDVTNPLFLLLASWIFSFVVLVAGDYSSAVKYLNGYSFLLLFSIWIFGLGGVLGTAGKIMVNPKMISCTPDKLKARLGLRIFMSIEVLLFAFLFAFSMREALSNFSYNIWYSINEGVLKSIPGIKTACIYISPIMIVLMNVLFVHYLSTGKDKKYFIAQSLITVLLVFLSNGRAGLLRLMIPMVYIYMVMRKRSNLQIIRWGAKALIAVIIIFFVYNFLKRVTVEGNQIQYAVNSFLGYSSGGITAFSQWCNAPHRLYYGAYTFRPVFTLLRACGYPVEVVSVFEPFLRGPGGTLGNVYTSLKWYANDVGVVYALIIQFFFGVLHLHLYYKMQEQRTTGYIIACATSIYPLLMQFFSDQYVTSTVIWILYFIAGTIFLRTPLFFERKKGKGNG